MKTKTILSLTFLIASIALLQCTKVPLQEVLKTRLIITLRDAKGDTVKGIAVRLYKKDAADTSAIVQIADSSGIVLYPNLEVATYYWLAKKGCKTNLASQTTLGKPLVEGVALYGYSVMAETSTLRLKNTDTARYKFSDSTLSFILPGDTAFITYPKIGRHRLTQRRVYAPTVFKDTVIIFNCTDTVLLNIPF